MERDEAADTDPSAETREQGIEFGALTAKLAAHEYPTSREALLVAHGDFELELPGGSETLREILERRGSDTDDSQEAVRYESSDDVHQSIHNLVGSAAVGREDYSDRAGSMPGEDRNPDSL